ncbi:MAG: glycosyltransferase, partial [bacterium]|nr:glycosyltransferase [bacterium]
MKVIYVGTQKDYYNPDRGYSFEYNNFYPTLKNMEGMEVIEYPMDSIAQIGKVAWNHGLLDLVRREKPDVLFAFMLSDEFDKEMLLEIKKLTTSIAWFADDSWRFYNYSRNWPPYFTWVVTTYSYVPGLYAVLGHANVIRSQWGANPNAWHAVPGQSKDIDVSFVGQRNPMRARVVDALREAGIKIFVRGWGWSEGKASQAELMEIIARSKINLNINSQPSLWDPKSLARLLLRRSCTKIVPDFNFAHNFASWRRIDVPQVKARPFELAATGAFVISGFADDIEKYYAPDEEMVFYRTTEGLIEKIRQYLAHDIRREEIAR